MGVVTLTGDLTGGPGSAGGSVTTFNAPVVLSAANKSFTAATGVLVRAINSPGAFVALSSVGANADVPAADTFYLKTSTAMSVRLTQQDGIGGTTVQVVDVAGLMIVEAPSNKKIVLIEIKGSGSFEYFASGS